MIPLTNFAVFVATVSTHQVVTDAWQTPKNSYSIPFDRPGASSYLKPRTNCQLFQSSNVVTTTPSILELDETTASSTADLYDASSAPKDETFSLLNPVKRYYRPLVTPGFPSFSKSIVHDVALSTSGGVWQSNFLGKRVYGTSSHRPDIVRQLAKAEAKGKLLNDWPENIREILGKDSLLAVEDVNADESFFIAKKVLVDALSTRNLIQRAVPVIEGELEKVMARWDAVATTSASSKTSAITVYGRDVTSLTFNVIIHTIFGRDALSEDEVAVLREHIAHITKGLAAFPINVPILRKIPFLRRYHRALKARESLKDLMVEKIQEKRMRLEQSLVDPSISFESSGILDDFILQLYSSTASSTSSDQPQLTEERVLRFCLDNTILSIFAGFDTTASVSTNILLLLHNDPRALQLVREELSSFDITTAIPKGKVEVMDSLPALKSVLLETFRLRPAIPFSFRKTADAIVVGNTILPAGSTVQLSYSHGGLSEKLYEDPGMVCPLRFYNKITDNSSNGSSTSDDDIVKKGSVDEDEGGRPNIFGYGKHLCPGQYLAQMEIALVTKAMVCNYDFELVEGQDTSQCVPLNAPKSGLKLRLSKRE